MANILPVSDLRNYNEVLKNCHKGEPVYLTVIRQIKRCRFHQIKTGLSEHLTMG